MAFIEVRDLTKEFTSIKKETGLRGALKGLVVPKKELVRAVDGVSFSIPKGEIVGYIGPNGSGKSTTIKMMCGILRPTAGQVLIDGLDPQKERKRVVQNLGVVFGQRTQLYWDLRLGESFELLKRIYRVPDEAYRRTLEEMQALLNIDEIVDTPVRQLSLGQRMRGDLVAAMLHSPATVFLDEPTIGLDIDAKQAIRSFIKGINAARGATVILTTHDLDDIQELCSRIIVLNHGKIIEDGSLREIIDKIAPVRRLIVDLERLPPDPRELEQPPAYIVKQEGARVVYEFPKGEIAAPALIAALSQRLPVRDISLEEADIEDIIQRIYRQ